MKKAFLFLLAAIPMLAVDVDLETGVLMNGRAWVGMKDYAKVAYVRGAYDYAAVTFTRSKEASCDTIHPIEMEGTTVGEMTKALDGFYGDSLNRRIPIIAALQWVKMKHDGATTHALEDQAAKLRAAFNIQH